MKNEKRDITKIEIAEKSIMDALKHLNYSEAKMTLRFARQNIDKQEYLINEK